jgi:rod shape-determining protein MreC
MTGKVNQRYTGVQQYFYLKRINDSLMSANEKLYNKLKENYALPDSGFRSMIDSIRVDSVLQHRKITYRSARVVSNSVNLINNFIVLDVGQSEGVRKDMGVITPNGSVIGKVVDVSDHYAVVMSLLHKDSRLYCRHEASGEAGFLNWDGLRPNYINLTGIPKSANLKPKDPILTSGYSTAFPPGLKVGTIESFVKDNQSSQYKVVIKTAADYNNLSYAFVIIHADQEGVSKILEKVKKNNP